VRVPLAFTNELARAFKVSDARWDMDELGVGWILDHSGVWWLVQVKGFRLSSGGTVVVVVLLLLLLLLLLGLG
jgi:hypothetical protein